MPGKSLIKMLGLLAICVQTVFAANSDNRLYLPSKSTKPFSLKLVASEGYINIVKNLSVSAHGGKFIVSEDQNIILRGKDAHNKKWEVDFGFEPLGLGYYLFEADLDKNGYKDAVLVSYTAANGFLPSCVIYFVMFDSEGRPVPFRVAGYFDVNKKGIAGLVTLKRNGKAELICQHYDDTDGRDQWDGYWITDIYETNAARWQKLQYYRGRKFPIFTYQENYSGKNVIPKSEIPARGRNPFAPDLSNNAPILTGRFVQANQSKLSESEFFAVNVKSPKGNVVRAAREVFDGCYLEDIISVVDLKDGRHVGFLYKRNDRFIQLKDNALLRNSSHIELYGRCAKSKYTPNMIWLQM